VCAQQRTPFKKKRLRGALQTEVKNRAFFTAEAEQPLSSSETKLAIQAGTLIETASQSH
jgi:hypothetical protein